MDLTFDQFIMLCVLATIGGVMIFMLYRAKREEEREARDAQGE